MTQDEIIRMAREAGLIPHEANIAYMQGNYPSKLERFAALVAAHEMQPEHFAKAIAKLVECCRVLAEENEAAVLAEREACAKVCEKVDLGKKFFSEPVALECAAVIRARSEK